MDSASIMEVERDRFRTANEASTVRVESTESSLSMAGAVRGHSSFFTR
jgi:hypothetical protein